MVLQSDVRSTMYSILLLLAVFASGTRSQDAATNQTEKVKVVSILQEPYLMQRDGKFEGFIVDMMDAVAEMISFDYELQLVKDGR